MLLYYLELGFEHITDIYGYDHILFIAALVSVYSLKHWRDILVLVTAFTIGHSVTLALATLNIVSLPSTIIEFLIPLTIFATSVGNFSFKEKPFSIFRFKYLITLFFGLIHGLGFSNFLKSILSSEESLVLPLLGFNIGVELGQLVIVVVIIGIIWLFHKVSSVSFISRNLVLSGMIAGMAIILIINRVPHFKENPGKQTVNINRNVDELSYCYPENTEICNEPDSTFFNIENGEKKFLKWKSDKLHIVFDKITTIDFRMEFFSQFTIITQIQMVNDSSFLLMLSDNNCCNCLNLLLDLEMEDNVGFCSPVFENSEGNSGFIRSFRLEERTGEEFCLY